MSTKIKFAHLCPVCKSGMVKRTNKLTKVKFWGCTMFPKCVGSRNLQGHITTRGTGGPHWGEDEYDPEYDAFDELFNYHEMFNN